MKPSVRIISSSTMDRCHFFLHDSSIEMSTAEDPGERILPRGRKRMGFEPHSTVSRLKSTMKSPEPSYQPYKRQRVRKACLPCRERKRKCDGKSPCGMCVAYGYECQYTEEKEQLVRSKIQRVPNKIRADKNDPKYSSVTSNNSRSISDSIDTQDVTDGDMIQHSAIAFPRSLGLEFLSADPPRLHSFAWHCGIRPEENANTHGRISDLVSKREYCRLLKKYILVVHPIFDIVDPEELERSAEKYWGGEEKFSDYEAVVAGVIALGSFFSGKLGHPRELEVVQFAKGILDDPAFSRAPSVEQVSAWVLRTIYLRATARPHIAWLTSCVTIHLAEAIALHHEIDRSGLSTIRKIPLNRATEFCERARSLFWCAWSINAILSYDYGQSSVVLSEITCELVNPKDNNFTVDLARLAQLIPKENSDQDEATKTRELLQALKSVYESPNVHPFLSLTKSDICLSFYRRLRPLNHVLDKSVVSQIISIGNAALSAALELVKIDQSWWNVLSTSFQYVCVLLAIDTPQSLAHVASAMGTLDSIAEILGTHIAFEAQNTAKLLLEDSMNKKRQEIQQLERAIQLGPIPDTSPLLDIDWDLLLDPSVTRSFV